MRSTRRRLSTPTAPPTSENVVISSELSAIGPIEQAEHNTVTSSASCWSSSRATIMGTAAKGNR